MSSSERRKIGARKMEEVYAGDVTVPAEGYAFTDVMLETLFAEVWTRDTLSMRDRRILLLGMLAAQSQHDTFKIQVKAALKRGELTADEVRELHLFIAQYCGYPTAAALITPMETAIAEAQEKPGDVAAEGASE
ncbi:carboxymuconolactone decarboxylase family protein [Pseudohalioglobus sediminis]|uniref:Carboxymuconolactone decarboxylase family protein n=1 Tax=Pseudohalioglobus sediminis TaxID=2606449 RepID=A0A5B0X1W6_9GAMM|nr:carboxymuconolactone decarboxylase family protein [Pseudohalioglobus sediminis]KAA1193212.1 carboxymuconolactone decarboxylase family protein [Pseudohalioglobus sediminis]